MEDRKIVSRVERFMGLLKDISITAAALFALSYYLWPGYTRAALNFINPDRAWYFVGTWDGQRLINPRFHAALNGGKIPHDKDGLVLAGVTLFPYGNYTAGGIDFGGDVGKSIVGRRTATASDYRIEKVVTRGKCIYVRSAKHGHTVWLHRRYMPTIWVKGILIDCASGY